MTTAAPVSTPSLSALATSVVRWLTTFDPFGPYSPQPARAQR